MGSELLPTRRDPIGPILIVDTSPRRAQCLGSAHIEAALANWFCTLADGEPYDAQRPSARTRALGRFPQPWPCLCRFGIVTWGRVSFARLRLDNDIGRA